MFTTKQKLKINTKKKHLKLSIIQNFIKTSSSYKSYFLLIPAGCLSWNLIPVPPNTWWLPISVFGKCCFLQVPTKSFVDWVSGCCVWLGFLYLREREREREREFLLFLHKNNGCFSPPISIIQLHSLSRESKKDCPDVNWSIHISRSSFPETSSSIWSWMIFSCLEFFW
jgi:hypothetical protein